MRLRRLHSRQIMKALSLREFSKLCALLDDKTGQRVVEKKFNVLRIERSNDCPSNLRVQVDVGGGLIQWHSL